MILSRLDLKAFGRFTDVTLDLSAGPRRFHLVYGPNESGKSTSLRAITSLLFGIPHITEDNFLHANTQLRIGGLLIDGQQQLDCVRRKGKKATLRDADDNEPIDESSLESMLGGIDRETFSTRFGLSHDELVAGGAAILSGEGDLGQILFSAGAGIGRLREVQEDLDEAAAALFTPRGTKTAIAKSLQKMEEQRAQLRQSQVPPAQYRDLCQRLEMHREKAQQLSTQIEHCMAVHNRLRHYQQALPLVPRWRSTLESLKACSDVPRLDEGFTERRRQAVSEREIARSRRAELQGRITEMTSRLESMPEDESIVRHQAEIQAVFQEVAARDKAQRDREGLIRNRNNLDRKITDLLGQLSIEVPGNFEVAGDDASDGWPAVLEESIEKLKVSDANRSRIRQLAASYEKLISQRNEASDHVESIGRRLSDLCDELESMGTPADPTVISTAIDSVGNPQSMLEAVAEQRESCDTLEKRCDTILRRLEGFDGTADDAAQLSLPDRATVDSLASNIDRATRELEAAENHRRDLDRDFDELSQQIQQQQAELPLPTVTELSDLRSQRDAVTDALRELASKVTEDDRETLSQTIEQLNRQIEAVDQVTDTMRTHHQQVHRREQSSRQLKQLSGQRASCESRVVEAAKQRQEAIEQWEQMWMQCQVRAGDAERMQRWVADHHLLCESLHQWRESQRRLDQLQNRIQVSAARLGKALASRQHRSVRSKQPVAADAYQGGLFDDGPEDDLIALYDEALAARSETMQQRQHFESLRRRRDELTEELPKAETRLETAQRQVQQWRDEWQRTTSSFTSSDRVSTEEVSLMLDQIAELHSKKRERDILVRRIGSIHHDESEFQSRVERLVAATQLQISSDLPPTVVAQELYQRLQSERTAAQTRGTLREQIELSKQRIAEAQSQLNATQAILSELCREAGCDSPDDLPEIEREARRRAELESELRDLENQLSLLAGDAPLEEFIEEAGKQQPGTLEAEIETKESTLNELREQQSEIQQEIGALQHELRQIDGGGRASQWIQSIQLTAGDLTRDCEEFARSRIASLILRRAIDHYRQAHQSPILQHANRFFRQLTCDAYRELRPDYDSKGRTTLFGIQESGETVPAPNMSDGTADALYLALRLASLQYQIGMTKPIPLVIDDCLIQLDDARATAALRAFSDLSETTQVILFTHHRHVVDLARANLGEGEFHLHRLGDSGAVRSDGSVGSD